MTDRRPEGASAPQNVTLRNWKRADVAGLEGSIRGLRVALVNEQGTHHDFRAWTELRIDRGATVLWVVQEAAWWRNRHLAMDVEPLRWPATAVWVET